MTRRRLWAYRLMLMAIAPVLSLGLAELILAMVGIQAPPGPTRQLEIDGETHLIPDPGFTTRFFPPKLQRESWPWALSHPKRADSVRVLVLGGSAAQGDPASAFGFARILEKMLESRHPEIDFEIANCAMTAINSHVVRELSREIKTVEPDHVLIYMGNNEIVGPYGPANPFFGAMPWSWLKRTRMRLGATRVGQVLESVGRRGRGVEAESWKGMEMFLAPLRSTDKRVREAHRQYAENLRSIVEDFPHAQVLLATVPANRRDQPPFGSEPDPGLSRADLRSLKAHLSDAARELSRGLPVESLAPLEAALIIDPTHAEAWYRLGHALADAGRLDRADRAWRQALEHDTLRFRADSGIQAAIRAIGSETGATVVEAALAVEAVSRDRIPGREVFFEHVHPTFRGNHAIAQAFLQAMDLPASDRPVLTEDQAARRLGWTREARAGVAEILLVRYRRTPFSELFDNAARIQAEERIRAEAAAWYDQHGHSTEEDDYTMALAESPRDFKLHQLYGAFLFRLGREEEAREHFEHALTIAPHTERELPDVIRVFLGR